MNLADQIERHISTAKDLERLQRDVMTKQDEISKFTASKRERETIVSVKYNAGQSVDGILTFDCARLNGETLLLEFVPSAAQEIAMKVPMLGVKVEPL